jgi:hypothetical protein
MQYTRVLQSLSSSLYSGEKKIYICIFFFFLGQHLCIILGQRTGHNVPSKPYYVQYKDNKVKVAVNPLEILVTGLRTKY